MASDAATAAADGSKEATLSTAVIVILAIAGTVVVLLVGALGYRAVVGAKKQKTEDATTTGADNYSAMGTPQSSANSANGPRDPTTLSDTYLANDVRNDKAMSLFRIDTTAIQLGEAVARGGFGVVYRGVYAGKNVAVKQMLPDTWREESMVADFMDEIRLCVSLDHPKIVQCIGISWTSLRDLSVVTEYMSGGDLEALLTKQTDEPTGREWSEFWTASKIKSKTSIAANVAEAIVYLHSFNKPIIHRDLKAKNVLLDKEGNAKLSDFGISREVPMDETMTREVGTVAWIAPEVLRGDRYSEKANIYSLGVLLVELDCCRHPYRSDGAESATDSDSSRHRRTKVGKQDKAVLKNTRIAILVSNGKLRPTVSATCPDEVKQVVERCLSFDAEDRPNAMEVHHALRRLREQRARGGTHEADPEEPKHEPGRNKEAVGTSRANKPYYI